MSGVRQAHIRGEVNTHSRTVPIWQDLPCRRLGQHLSAPIGTIQASDGTNPTGFALSLIHISEPTRLLSIS